MVCSVVVVGAGGRLVDVGAVGESSGFTRYEGAEKRQAQLSNGEAVALRTYPRNSVEKGVLCAIHERSVEIGHCHSWILEICTGLTILTFSAVVTAQSVTFSVFNNPSVALDFRALIVEP